MGMPWNEEFRKLVCEGMERYGVNHGASRNNNNTLDIFSVAEKFAAERFRAEDAIILSSGYLAAQLVVQNYFDTYQLFYAPDAHPALWIGKPNPPLTKFSDWAEQAIDLINGSDDRPSLIISNSLNNLMPEIYDFEWLKRIDPAKSVVLLVDDSHGIGITGEVGEGVFSRIPALPNIETFVIGSMAKALGLDAGYIIGSMAGIQDLRKSPIYAGSSPPSPGMLHAFVNGSEIYGSELKHLRKNIRIFANLLQIKPTPCFIKDFPVFLLPDNLTASILLEQGIIISSFPYPDPEGKMLNRIVISSIHKTEDLEILADAINEGF